MAQQHQEDAYAQWMQKQELHGRPVKREGEIGHVESLRCTCLYDDPDCEVHRTRHFGS